MWCSHRPQVPKECRRPVEAPEMLSSSCSRECRNGHCTPTGKCCCNHGWEGPSCLRGESNAERAHISLHILIDTGVKWKKWAGITNSAYSSQPSVNLLAEMVASASNPTSASVRKAFPGHSVRKGSEAPRMIVTKVAFWITSLTWHHICWTSPATLSRSGRMTAILYSGRKAEF